MGLSLTDSVKAVELAPQASTSEDGGVLSMSRLFKDTWVVDRAVESSIAERLHDLARNSMDSVGVSGGAHDNGSHFAGPFSSIFSSFCDELFIMHELTANTKTSYKLVQVCSSSLLRISLKDEAYNHTKAYFQTAPTFSRLSWNLKTRNKELLKQKKQFGI